MMDCLQKQYAQRYFGQEAYQLTKNRLCMDESGMTGATDDPGYQ